MLLLLASALTSCKGMWDDEGQDCTTYKRIRFTYDWNMLYADAFAHEVKTLTLYAFNTDGSLAWSRTEDAASVAATGYLDVSDAPSGVYTFQVWAEGEQRNANTYVFGQPLGGTNARQGLTAALAESAAPARDADGQTAVAHDLTPLYYGQSGLYGTEQSADFTDMPLGGVRETTINLMKDTENFRIVLQDQNGETLDPAEFHFYITDDNGFMNADNYVVATGDTLRYEAWSLTNAEAGVTSGEGSTTTGVSALVSEFTTNRLVAGHNMRLHVKRTNEEKEIINIPLIDLCYLVKGNYNRDMTNQEYLDRQDTWNFVFFLSQGKWASASVIIQSWRVVLDNTDLGGR